MTSKNDNKIIEKINSEKYITYDILTFNKINSYLIDVTWILYLYSEQPSSNKRKSYIDWDDYFMALAFLSAKRSKDPRTQVGACIVNEQKQVVGIGYNGMPNGCSDDVFPWTKESVDPLETKTLYGELITSH